MPTLNGENSITVYYRTRHHQPEEESLSARGVPLKCKYLKLSTRNKTILNIIVNKFCRQLDYMEIVFSYCYRHGTTIATGWLTCGGGIRGIPFVEEGERRTKGGN